jgi:radical SAM superfamily enzyme YgiQ (UPF0313 family)
LEPYTLDKIEIAPGRCGADRFTKASYPIRYGRWAEIRTPDYLFQFNLNGEIRHICGLNGNWPHPAEWLRRTDGNDWIYFSTGGYSGVFSTLGEYYRPCLPYPSNSIWEYDPFGDPRIPKAIEALSGLRHQLDRFPADRMPADVADFCRLAAGRNTVRLKSRADELHEIIGTTVSVLPPDARHVDYNIIPVMIADGCLYQCKFCSIKSRQGYKMRSRQDIRQQILKLKKFYGADLPNYNAVFLGNHDALAAGHDLIYPAAAEAYAAFGFEYSYMKNPALFLFGSVDSFLRADKTLFESLNLLGLYTYINIGLESADTATLKFLNKPLNIENIKAAFNRMLDINRNYPNIEVTANFLTGEGLPPEHYQSIIELTRNRLKRYYSKGAVYLSPLMSNPGGLESQKTFMKIKNLSRLPVYLYLIQRL